MPKIYTITSWQGGVPVYSSGAVAEHSLLEMVQIKL